MKNIIYKSLLFCTIILLQSCGEEENHPDMKLFQLNGRVKSLKYNYSTNGNDDVCPGFGMDYYGSYYVYQFNEYGEWINPIEKDIVRNDEGYIVRIGNYEIEWDSNGQLKARKEILEDPDVNNIEYYLNKGGYVDSLLHIDGGEGGTKHNYFYEGNNDENYNWISVRVVRSLPAFNDKYNDEFVVERNIEYWTEEDLLAAKKERKIIDDSNNEVQQNEDTQHQKILRSIAGTYEIYEHRGVQGLHTWCILKINSDGTGVKIEEGNVRTNIIGTHINDDNTISFSLSDGSGEIYRYSSFSGTLDLINPRMYNGMVIDGIRKR